jgi:exosortase
MAIASDRSSGDAKDPVSFSQAETVPVTTWALLAALGLALAPLLYHYFAWSWIEGHYQYFPLLIAAVVAMVWLRRDQMLAAATTPRSALLAIGLAIAALLTLAGHLLGSGFLGILAAISAAVTLVYGTSGWGGLRKTLPVLSLLLLAIPLPLGLDNYLIFNMQFAASGLADLMLDGAGIQHVREGVLLITESGRYMTEEACSGVRSLFSSLAVVAVYSVVSYHRWPRLIINVVQTVFWVFIGNSIRVALCVYLADNVSVWFASGTGHEILSLVVFAFILGMVGNTDAILASIMPESLQWYEEPKTIKTERKRSAPPKATRHYPNASRTTTVFAAIFGVLAIFGGLAVRSAQPPPAIATADANRMPALIEPDLPPAIAVAGQNVPWMRQKFEHVEREVGAMLAADSYTWVFAKGDLSAVVSVDCPWNEWHNLNDCYRAIGWETTPTYFVSSPSDAPRSDLTYTDVQMQRSGKASTGRVMFTVVDRNGREVQSKQWRMRIGSASEFASNLGARLRTILLGDQSDTAAIELPATTIQLMAEHAGELTEAERAELAGFFFEVRRQLLEGRRWAQPESGEWSNATQFSGSG